MHASFAVDLVRLRRGRGVIVSAHLFGPQNDAAIDRLPSIRALGAEVVKLAVEVQSLTETLPFFEYADRPDDGEDSQGHVLVAMGPCGAHTRVLGARLRNRWTYAGDGVAPGQMPASRLLGEFRFRQIRPDAELYGVVGSPVAHSLSPAMHNAGFVATGRNAAYLALEARDADDFVRFARAMDLRGASVTAPFKVAMMDHVDERDPLVEQVGAMNTVAIRDGRWLGANTDVAGFLAPLKGRMALRGARIAVLGAGGAARAVAIALKREGATVRLAARRDDEASDVAERIGVEAGPYPPAPGRGTCSSTRPPAAAGPATTARWRAWRWTARSCSTSFMRRRRRRCWPRPAPPGAGRSAASRC